MHNKVIKKNRLIMGLLFGIFFLCTFLAFLLFEANVASAVSPEWTGGIAANFAGGTGTENDPYLISTGEQLAYFSQRVNAGITYAGSFIQLTQDILLNSMNADGTFVSASPRQFTKIGSNLRKFQGQFNGAGYEIIGLYIDKPNESYQGLFGYADTGSMIRNVSISGRISGKSQTGCVAGYTNGGISNCTTNCAVISSGGGKNYTGGVTGEAGAGSKIIDCTVSRAVSGYTYVGGVAGKTEGEITRCSVNGTVTGSYDYVGGIAGYAGTGSKIIDCTVSEDISGNNMYVGGVAGKTEGEISGCSVSATITAPNNSYIGGIAGYAAGIGSKITDCTVSVIVNEANGGGYVGGVAGRTDGEIRGCTASVTVTGPNSYIGGIAGYAYGAGSKISECTVSGTVTAASGFGYVGGVVGKTDGVITECTSDCTVTGLGQHNVGGVAGYAGTESVISNCSSAGDVSGIAEIGGVVGYTDGVVTICINTGTVNGSNGHTGGVVGAAGGNSTVSNSFNSGAIDGGNGQGGVGGIVGYANPDFTIYHNLSVGTVEGNQLVGGVVGNGNAIHNDNAWNNYYLDYEGAPDGTNSGDVLNNDGALPIGDMTWEEVYDRLDDDEGEGVWSQDMDDNGIPKPEVTVAEGEIVSSKIKEGKYYTAAFPEATSITITSDSVFTGAFNVHYNEACNLATQTIGLMNGETVVTLPAGTSIIMLVDGAYYYKNMETALGTRLPLNEFYHMGSGTLKYAPAESIPAGATKEYLFIFDFSKTAGGIAAGTYHIKLLPAHGTFSGTMPTVAVAGKNAYTLTASSGTDRFTVSLGRVLAPGYDFKTDGKISAFEFCLVNDEAVVPLPVGTKINGNLIFAALPYVFITAAFEDNINISLDMSDCAVPLPPGNYTVQVKAYACSNVMYPRNGYVLHSGTADVALTAPIQYAIKASAETRVFDQTSSPIPVEFNIQTLGAERVKVTLQRKYGMVYANIQDQVNQPVTITDGIAILNIPAGYGKGTYRFVLNLCDDNGTEKAQAAQSMIIK
ncbi:GLUG motif-containing protein [Candidatus Formimonas warabiya]|uniref:GLUG domain-containing protein n=1 Tax=Formimonas warabiya TaxID=1761012 RepID=A0A3G1KLY9_FORW1|nr:GLUG motif-containing protein [Candidatus Formimonas warabiya]ATW23437.1 hypothetical protein DCMF_00275 [Candidatus Formimonas warabiya]